MEALIIVGCYVLIGACAIPLLKLAGAYDEEELGDMSIGTAFFLTILAWPILAPVCFFIRDDS